MIDILMYITVKSLRMIFKLLGIMGEYRLIAYCGINCTTCPLYMATMNNDALMKQEISLKWGKLYNRLIDIKDMECYGCKSSKKFCLSNECNITTCNISKGIETCSQCSTYPCERINKFYEWQENNDTNVEIVKL